MTEKTPFSAEAWKNVDWLRQATDCFDLTIRSVNVNDRQCLLVFVGGVTGTTSIEPIVESLVFDKGNLAFFPATVTQAGSLEDALDKILQGQTLVILEGSAYAFIVDTRSYPTRGPSEPTVEKSIRGARDGFIEHIMLDLGMVRRRIRDPKLVTKAYQKGSRTKTDIFVLYISDLIHPSILHDFQNRIDHLPANAEVTSERQLCELMYGQTWNPYPHVRYTERPDIAAIHLLQGSLIVLVDNCPSAVILPTTFFEQTKQIEEYTQTPVISLVMRAIRLAGVFCSIYLLPLWMVLVMQLQPDAPEPAAARNPRADYFRRTGFDRGSFDRVDPALPDSFAVDAFQSFSGHRRGVCAGRRADCVWRLYAGNPDHDGNRQHRQFCDRRL